MGKNLWKLKRILACVLTLCMVLTGVSVLGYNRVKAEAADSTTVYFYNTGGWENVGAHAWSSAGDLTGDWNTTHMTPSTIGEGWYEVTINAAPAFSLIVFNADSDGERITTDVVNTESVYFTGATDRTAYTGREEAEKAADEAVNGAQTVISFLNWDGEKEIYEEIYAYVYGDAGETLGTWPGAQATEGEDHWWSIEVPANAELTSFNLIINNGIVGSENGGKQLKDLVIKSLKDNYAAVPMDGDGTPELFTSQYDAEQSVGLVYETTVYYLNSYDWPEVGAYVWGASNGKTNGEALGDWPGKVPADPAPEIGEKWVKVTVPAKAGFNMIFHDTRDTTETVRSDGLVSNAKVVYFAGCKAEGNAAIYGDPVEAELAMGVLNDPDKVTTLYFYNSRELWDPDIVNCYAFREDGEDEIVIGSGWPGAAAEKAPEVGDGWWKMTVPRVGSEDSPFYVIFNDGMNQTEEVKIIDKKSVYITAGGTAWPNADAAMKAAAEEDLNYDDGCEEGPNADLDSYQVNYTGAGAVLPYVTYEAEDADVKGENLKADTGYRTAIQSEASGRRAVKLENEGDYVQFTLTKPANSLVMRYSMPDNASGSSTGIDATLSMYIDGAEADDLNLTSKYAWIYNTYGENGNTISSGNGRRFFDETRLLLGKTLPAGSTIKLQKDAADSADWYIIDFIECELVGEPLKQPEGSLSVTDKEFGAVADDGKDDRAAFEACIAAAQEQGKEVWIPAGTFDLTEKKALQAEGVTIRGAGMWYSNLYGAGAAFQFAKTCKFYDFAMTGVSDVRNDSGDPAGFENNGRSTNVTIQNIWMEHMKVGIWTGNNDRMVVQGCRIRNTYADGINLSTGTNDAVVRNNNVRNTGDDCIASWPWNANCTGNTIEHNTIQVPTLANGVAIYGGGDQVVDGNYIADTIINGGGIVVGSEFATPKGYTGTVTVKNNVMERCGSWHEEGYMVGAIWIWASFDPMNAEFDVYHNVMNDCPQSGITIEATNELTGLNIQYNTVDGAKYAVYEYVDKNNQPGKEGSGKIGNTTHRNISEAEYLDEAPNFNLVKADEEIAGGSGSEGESGNPGGSGSEGESGNPGGSGSEGESGNPGGSGSEGESGNPGGSGSEGESGNPGGSGSGETSSTEVQKKPAASSDSKLQTELTDSVDYLKSIIAELAEEGETGASVYVAVEDVSKAVSAENKKLAEDLVKEKAKDYAIGAYLDLNLIIERSTGSDRITHELGGPLTVTVTLPENLIDGTKNRAYKIVRIHNGKAELLDTEFDAKKGTLTFQTDRFSTYAIAYYDAASTGQNTSGGQNGAPPTGDPMPLLPMAGLLLGAAGIAAAVRRRQIG